MKYFNSSDVGRMYAEPFFFSFYEIKTRTTIHVIKSAGNKTLVYSELKQKRSAAKCNCESATNSIVTF